MDTLCKRCISDGITKGTASLVTDTVRDAKQIEKVTEMSGFGCPYVNSAMENFFRSIEGRMSEPYEIFF